MGALALQIYRLMCNAGYSTKDFSSVFQFLQESQHWILLSRASEWSLLLSGMHYMCLKAVACRVLCCTPALGLCLTSQSLCVYCSYALTVSCWRFSQGDLWKSKSGSQWAWTHIGRLNKSRVSVCVSVAKALQLKLAMQPYTMSHKNGAMVL